MGEPPSLLMSHGFQISALPQQAFAAYFTMSDTELREHNAAIVAVDCHPGYPCRVSLRDAEVGETVLALAYAHHPASSPYRASGPIFVRRDATTRVLDVNEVPKMLLSRDLSLRAYDDRGWMTAASVCPGCELAAELEELFARPEVDYVDIHNAGPGCFDCRAMRADRHTPPSLRGATL